MCARHSPPTSALQWPRVQPHVPLRRLRFLPLRSTIRTGSRLMSVQPVRDDMSRRTLTLFAVGAFLLAPAARAQRAEAEEGIVLRIHPRVGDTLHTRLDQQTEVSAVVAGSSKSVTTAVTLKARTIVQSSLPASTVVL